MFGFLSISRSFPSPNDSIVFRIPPSTLAATMLARAALAALLATAASAAPLLKAKQGSGGPGDWSQPGGPDFDWCALFVFLPRAGAHLAGPRRYHYL